MEERHKLLEEINELRKNLSNENLQLMPEFQRRQTAPAFFAPSI